MLRILLPALLLLTGCGTVTAPEAATCDVPDVIGHRGAPNVHTENTLPSMRSGYRAGAAMVEVDVQSTQDHAPVLMHDHTVDRTTDGTGRVDEKLMPQIRDLRTEEGYGVPRLRGALSVVNESAGRELLLEIKGPEGPRDAGWIAHQVKHVPDRVIVQSFKAWLLKQAGKHNPDTRRMQLVSSLDGFGPAKRAERYGFYGYSVRNTELTAVNVAEMQDAGLTVFAWTPHREAEWERLADIGVDGIITNKTWKAADWADGYC